MMTPLITQTSRTRALRSRAQILTLAIGTIGTFAFAVACGGPEDLEVTEQELVGGIDTNLRPEVGVFRGCTATLIHERYVLTAAHCLFRRYTGIGLATGVPSDYIFLLGITPYEVDKVHSFAYDRYDYTQSGDRLTDVALLRLVDKVPPFVATPTRLAERMPRNGEGVTLFGFGCESRVSQTGGGNKQFFEFAFGNSTQALCPGDSGGPAFLGAPNGGGALWGINSDYDGPGQFVDFDDIFGDVTGLKVQIEAVIRQWEGGNGLEPDFDRPGGDYHTFLVSSNSAESCRTACNGDSQCLAFSFRPSVIGALGECRLKDQMSGMRPRSGYTSGTSASRFLETDTDRPGGGYRSFSTSSSNACQNACAEEARCAAFTHFNNRCWLKSEEGTPQLLTGAVSGRKNGLEMNTDRPGSGYRNFAPSTQDPEHCQSACSRDSACQSWTYTPPSDSRDAWCWLKNAVPNARNTVGIASGFRRDSIVPSWNEDKPNTDRPGNDYRTLSTANAVDCRLECQLEPNSMCNAWTWVPPRSGTGARCYLKDAIPNPLSTHNMVSGRKGFEYHPEPTF